MEYDINEPIHQIKDIKENSDTKYGRCPICASIITFNNFDVIICPYCNNTLKWNIEK